MGKFCDVMYKCGIPAVIFLMIVCGIIIRIKLVLINQSMWSDECSLYLNISQADYWKFFKPLDWLQVAPPVFMVIEKLIFDLFKNVLPMEMIPRLFPCFCSIATLILLPLFVEKVYKNRVVTAIITFMTAFTPYVVNYANEVKQYSCELFVAVLVLMFFYFFDVKKFSKKTLIICTFLISMAPLLAFSSFFIIVAGSVIVLYNLYQNRKEINFPVYSLCFLIPLVITEFSIYFFIVKPIFDDKYVELVTYFSVTEPCMFTLSSFYGKFSTTTQTLFGNFCGIDYSHWHLFFWFSVVLLLVHNNKKLAFLLLGSVTVTVLASFAHVYPYDCRLILFLFSVFSIIYVQAFLFLDKKCYSAITVIVLFVATMIAYNYHIDKYVIHRANIREAFMEMKKVNPELKNIIGPEGGWETYSGGQAVLGINVWAKFDEKIFKEDMCDLPDDIYYVFLPDDTQFNADLRKMVINSVDFEVIPLYDSNGAEYRNVMKIRNLCTQNGHNVEDDVEDND